MIEYNGNNKNFNAFEFGDNYPQFNNEHIPEELAKEAIKSNAYENIKKAIKRYGLEGTEDKIKELYNNTKTQRYLLKILYEIWKG